MFFFQLDYIENVESSQRTLQRSRFVFSKQARTYNAYEKDIAVLQVFFDSSPILQVNFYLLLFAISQNFCNLFQIKSLT